MKKFKIETLAVAVMVFCSASVFAQKPTIYHPEADAKAQIAEAVAKAGKNNRHVLLQIGGNWCSWCILFDRLVNGNDTLRTFRDNNYEMLHVNYSPENKNEEVLASLEYPQRFGFPVFVILDGKGRRIHTQNSAYLEKGKGHDPAKVLEFFQQWAPASLDPAGYTKK